MSVDQRPLPHAGVRPDLADTATSGGRFGIEYAAISRHLGGWRGVGLRAGIVALGGLAATQHVLRSDSMWLLLACALAGAVVVSREALAVGVYACLWFAFSLLRAVADNVGFADRGAPVAAIDRWLGGGVTPTERLQDAFFQAGRLGWLDHAAIWTHSSYYVLPHLVAIALWWRDRRLPMAERDRAPFALYLRGIVALMALGMFLYVLAPTAPPWLQGTRDEALSVHRITSASNADQSRDPEQVYTLFTDPNPIAAMPSLHQAFTVLLALALWRERRWLGLLGGVYAVAMGFALVYLGEHYLIDVIVGAVLAGAVAWFVWARWGGTTSPVETSLTQTASTNPALTPASGTHNRQPTPAGLPRRR